MNKYKFLFSWGLILIFVFLALTWNNSRDPTEIYLAKDRLAKLSYSVPEDQAHLQIAAIAFAKNQERDLLAKTYSLIKYPYDKANFLKEIAQTSAKLNRLAETEKHLEQAIAEANQIEAYWQKPWMFRSIAETVREIEELPHPEKYLKQIIDILVDPEVENIFPKQQVFVLVYIAEIYQELNLLPEAEACLQQAIDIADRLENWDWDYEMNRGLAWLVIAEAYGKIDRSHKAEEYIKRVIINFKPRIIRDDLEADYADKDLIVKQLSDFRNIQPWFTHSILKTISNIEQLPQADRYTEQIAEIAHQIQNPESQTFIFSSVAETYGNLKQLPKAEKYLNTAINNIEQIQDNIFTINVLSNLVRVIGNIEDLPEANKYLERAIAIISTIKLPYYTQYEEKDFIQNIVDTAVKTNNLSQAKEYINRAVSILQERYQEEYKTDCQWQQAEATIAIAKTLLQLDLTFQAQKYLDKAMNFVGNPDFRCDEREEILIEIIESIGNNEKLSEIDRYIKTAIAIGELSQEEYSYSSEIVSKIRLLTTVTNVISEMEETTKADEYLKSIIAIAKQIDDYNFHEYDKRKNFKLFTAIVNVTAKTNRWRQAYGLIDLCSQDRKCEVEALANILTAWAKLKYPDLKEIEEHQF